MLGAIVGDVAGSIYEFANCKRRDIALLDEGCRLTDDSVMTLAVAEALLRYDGDMDSLEHDVIECMRDIGRRYPNVGYGRRFARWLTCADPMPYNSYGNGGAMRVSPVSYVGRSLKEVLELSDIVTCVTHNHAEGIKGARAIAACTYLACNGSTKSDIRELAQMEYYTLDFSLDEIRPSYTFYVDAMRSVPVAIEAFLEGNDFEDVMRLAISVGGDSDTIADMACAIAGAYYGVPDDIQNRSLDYLDSYQRSILERFEHKYL